jgi:hypothetical protein
MDFLIKLQNIFLGLVNTAPAVEEKESEPEVRLTKTYRVVFSYYCIILLTFRQSLKG